jgi:hypothetical protein
VTLLLKARSGWAFLVTKLNALGSLALAYALLNPSAASEMLNLLPPKLKTPAALAIPALWFLLVQFAKVRDMEKRNAA